MDYKNSKSIEQRTKETAQLLKKYPTKVPVYIEIPKNDMFLEKRKYLVDNDVNIMSLQILIRKSIKINSSEGIYMLVNKQLIPANTELGLLYEKNKSEDGLLYIHILKENTFGSL